MTGRTDPWVSLSISDIEEIEGLQALVYGSLVKRELFKPAPPGFFRTVLTGRGSILGYRPDGPLAAFGTLLTGLHPKDPAHELLGLAKKTPLAMMQGVVVHPDHRGQRLHRKLLRRRLHLLRPPGLWHVYASAAPGNLASCHNLLAEGYEVAALGRMYDGLLRYTFYRSPNPRSPTAPGEGLAWHDTLDVDGQLATLKKGGRGVVMRVEQGRPQMGYVEPA